MAELRDRERAERLWAVSVDRLPAASPVRRAFQRLARPLVDDQREFNDVVLKLVDELSERLDARLDERRLAELEERLLRLERRLGGSEPRSRVSPSSASTDADGRPAEAPFDYFAFESRMRGSSERVREKQAVYVDDFRGAEGPVLDAGCGRGEFLVLLRDAGIEAYGIDADADMIAFSRGEGLSVEQGDVLDHLDELEPGSLGGVFAAQLLEHLRPRALVRFLEVAADRLRPGAVLVAETINPLSLGALRSYFADLTHAQPLVPETLVVLARGAGFSQTELRFLNEPDESERLRAVELPPDPALDDARRALAVNVAKLNELLYGPQDYALVARR
jgi:SAM-dependent methyltransferase